MGGSVATLLIDIAANTSELKTGLDKARQELSGFRGNVDNAIGKLSGFASMFGRVAGGAAVIGTIAAEVKDLTAEFADAERKGLRLEAVLRATGNTVGLSAKQIKAMSEELASKSFFDYEAVTAAATELVTFGNIQGQVFKDALRLGTDVAEVFDKDITSAVLTVGKALADPAKGMEALRKIGIVLSADQEKAIQQFAKTNNLIGEQRTLIDALEKSVGGASETASGGLAGAWHRVALAIDDAKKSLGGFLVDLAHGKIDMGTFGQPKRSPFIVSGIDLTPHSLPDLTSNASIAGQTKEIGDLTALAELGKATDADIAKLRELRDGLAQALTFSGVDSETRLRVAREMKSITDALGDTSVLKPLRDFNATVGVGADELLRYNLAAKGFSAALINQAVALQRLGRDKTEMERWTTDLVPHVVQPQTILKVRDQLFPATEADRPVKDLHAFNQDAIDSAAEWEKAWTSAVEASSQAFANFFQQMFTEGAKLKDFLKGLLASVANVFATMASSQISKSILSTFDFGGSSTPVVAHTGGLVGAGGLASRSMPALAFAGAPRLHGGGWLAPDEVPAILQKGERVLSRSQVAAGAGSGPTVHVHQTINFPIYAMDGFSVRQVLDSQAGHIAGIIARAAREAPGYASHIVANGMRR